MNIKEFEEELRIKFCKINKIRDPKKLTESQEKLYNHWVLKRLFKKEVSSLFELNDLNIYDLITDAVKWYHMYGNNSTIDDLLDYKDKIITCTFRLSQRLSDITNKYENKVVENKTNIAKAVNKFSVDYLPTIAKEKAKISVSRHLIIEAQYKGEIKDIETLLSSLDKVVNAMTQRIAWHRQEYVRVSQS